MTDIPIVDVEALIAKATAAADQSDLGSEAYWWREAEFWSACGPPAVIALCEETKRLRELSDKYKWQVRDTCTRAERAEEEIKRLRASSASRDVDEGVLS